MDEKPVLMSEYCLPPVTCNLKINYVCVYVRVCVYLSLQFIVKVLKPTTILADLKISKTIGLSSAREREKVRGRIHVRTYIAGISSQYCDGGKNVKMRWREKLLTGSKYQSRL